MSIRAASETKTNARTMSVASRANSSISSRFSSSRFPSAMPAVAAEATPASAATESASANDLEDRCDDSGTRRDEQRADDEREFPLHPFQKPDRRRGPQKHYNGADRYQPKGRGRCLPDTLEAKRERAIEDDDGDADADVRVSGDYSTGPCHAGRARAGPTASDKPR
jgi:hypothetical protein